jgi:serine/threonine protein kinase
VRAVRASSSGPTTATATAGWPVALKVLHPRLRGASAYARLSEEIVMVRRVADFCTARVHELATDGDRSYVVSEYVDGPSLRELVERDGRPRTRHERADPGGRDRPADRRRGLAAAVGLTP